MKKKVIAALLTSAMAVSLLAGCGTTVESTGSSQSTSTTETKETAAPAETETAAVETEVAEEDNTDLSANIMRLPLILMKRKIMIPEPFFYPENRGNRLFRIPEDIAV